MSASVTTICNRALQMLGAKAIGSIDDDNRNAKACKSCYEGKRDELLRTGRWKFSLKRAELAAEATEPAFGRARSFVLPSDYLNIAPPYAEDAQSFGDNDFEIENGRILSDWSSPLQIRYVARITNVAEMDANFREVLAAEMALAMCEQITQSSRKKDRAERDLDIAWRKARKANALESKSQPLVETSWTTARRG